MNIKKSIIIVSSIFLFSFGFSQNAGTLDESFGNNGIVTTDFSSTSNIGEAVAIHEDGKITIAGYTYNGSVDNFSFAQYLEDGSPDYSFGSNGLLILDFGGSDDNIYDMAIQEDGKIIVAGSTGNSDATDFAIARLNPDGSLDNTFSNDGLEIVNFGIYDYGYAIKIQEDGKIIVVGITRNYGYFDLAMCRLNDNGSLDNSFGSNGKVQQDVNWDSSDFMDGLFIYQENIFVSGLCYGSSKADDGIAVLKYTNAGHLDNTFGEDGLAFFELELEDMILSAESDIAVNESGIYIAAHETNPEGKDFAIVSFLLNGYPNDDFGNLGLVVTDMIGENSANSISIQADNKIVISGYHEDATNGYDFCVARYLENGDLDAGFGEYYGVTWLNISDDINYPVDQIYSMAIQEDNKIVVAGFSNTISGDFDFAMARYFSGLEVGIDNNIRSEFNSVHVMNPINNYDLNIDFDLPKTSEVKIRLLNIYGKELGLILDKKLTKGPNSQHIKIDSSTLQGIYILKIQIENKILSYKVVIQ